MEGQTQLTSTPVEDFENGDFLMATKILTSRIRHESDNYELYLERSICHHKLGNYQASLDDAEAAIRLNSSEYTVHYQKSLALIRLYMFDEALRSALKAIELRAARADTKMSDIFKLIKDHIREMKLVREQYGESGQQPQPVRASEFGKTASTTSATTPSEQAATTQAIATATPNRIAQTPATVITGPNAISSKLATTSTSTISATTTVDTSSLGANKSKFEPVDSSTPITSNQPNEVNQTNPAPRDDSYSSKYKRLRRDRERARRGTSKLCTIKLADLDDLQKPCSTGERRHMRVIAPIDGWLYSGQLSVDYGTEDNAQSSPNYVVKLDGDSSKSSYLFTQETVLNDVIKEVRVKSVSDLRKGARICCYWSRTYKCLSTGVVTSRTFEATKSLVSVKYDNGDLSALPLEDLRLLPPDYPKYMSNCDPLLLAKSNDGTVPPSEQTSPVSSTNRIIVNSNSCNDDLLAMDTSSVPIVASSQTNGDPPQIDNADTEGEFSDDNKLKIDDSYLGFQPIEQDDSDDDVIPPTNQAINFITNEEIGSDTDEDDGMGYTPDRHITSDTKDNIVLTSEQQNLTVTNGSRASSEENQFGVEYRPWVFEGAPKRNKRHGRTHRDNYMSIRRGNDVLKIGDSAELVPRDASVLPFIAKIDALWGTGRGEMRVRVRWYYRLVETEDEPCDLKDGENALFETDHFDENDVQSIWRSAKILSWTEYSKNHLGHVNKQSEGPKVFYLAGYYDPVRRIKHLRSDVKEA